MLVACAADNHLDPSDLELRDVLGMTPEIAMAWDAGQRAAAREVIEAGMHAAPGASVHASLGADRDLATALGVADLARDHHRLAALGVVELALDGDALQATPRSSTLAPAPRGEVPPFELQLAGWSDRPGWAALPARGIDVLTSIAKDAGHRRGPVIVTPAAQLAVIAAYLPATAASPAHLVVNPVLLAALEPVGATAGGPALGSGPTVTMAVAPSDPVGNPYTFYASVSDCAAAQQRRCEACIPNGTCTPIAGTGDGTAQCEQLAADQGRGYSLVCINYALAIGSVATCTAGSVPSCPIDTPAGTTLETNADFLDRTECASALDRCLDDRYGSTPSSIPPPDTSPSCADSTCDASPSCDDSTGCEDGGACADSGGDSCSSDSGGDSCSGDSGDSGCSGGDSGGDCSGGGGGDCGGDSGGDCSGGGGDDCNAGHRRRDHGSHGYLWACLPLPFAVIARRRADRRRAKREVRS
ncbi:MAG: hypothetical protein ABI467_30265 [Kofleriaceae bacterium]